MRDYTGDMAFYQDQLTKAGITKDQLDMDNYCGLTARELQSIVNVAISAFERKKQEVINECLE